jgi:hypothetical protein
MPELSIGWQGRAVEEGKLQQLGLQAGCFGAGGDGGGELAG